MTVFPFPELDGEKEAEYDIFPSTLTRKLLLHTQGQTLPYLKFASDDSKTDGIYEFRFSASPLPLTGASRESGLGASDQVNRSLLHNKANQR